MIVISKVDTKRIVKGQKYEILVLNNAPTNTKKAVYIKNIGSFVAKNFTDINGNDLPPVSWR
jgi:hypothetical protein